MSEEIKSLKRLDVVNYLNELIPKLSPIKPDYKTKYIDYICEQYGMNESEIPSETYHDINLIKRYYNNASKVFKHMLKKHDKFFDASAIKTDLKRPSSSLPSSNVCISFQLINTYFFALYFRQEMLFYDILHKEKKNWI